MGRRKRAGSRKAKGSPSASRSAPTNEAVEPNDTVDYHPARARSFYRAAAAMLLITALGCVASWFPALGFQPVPNLPKGPFDLRFGLAGIGLASVLGLLALFVAPLRSLTLPATLLMGYCLFAIEERSQMSPWHRGVIHLWGLGPDVVLAVTWGAMLAGLRWRAMAIAGAVVVLLLTMSLVPIDTGLAPALLGSLVDTHQPYAPIRVAMVPLTLFALTLVGTWAWTSLGTRLRAPTIGGLGLLWALGSAAVAGEGFVEPLATWLPAAHIWVRAGVLGSMTLLVACTLVSSPADADKRWRHYEWALIVTIISAFVLVRLESFHWAKTDENIYFYAGQVLGDGILPYRDYFYAHPPLRVVVPAIVFAVFGFSLWSAQAIPLVAAIVSGLCIRACAHKILGPRRGAVAGMLALALHLSNIRTLIGSTEMSGVNMAAALMAGGLLAVYIGRARLAGILAGAALGVGMVVIWLVPVLGLAAAVVHGRRAMVHYTVAVIGTALGLFALGYALGGEAFLDGVFRFHTLKTAHDPRFVAPSANPFALLDAVWTNFWLLVETGLFYEFTSANPLTWIGGVAAPALIGLPLVDRWFVRLAHRSGATPRSQPRAKEAASDVAVAALPDALAFRHAAPLIAAVPLGVAFMSLLREHYSFYWAVFIPSLALLTGCAAALWLGRLQRQPTPKVALVLVVALAPSTIVADWTWNTNEFGERKHAGRLDHLDWYPSAPTTLFDGVLASLLWKPYVIRNEFEDATDRFLWMKKKTFSVAEDIATWVAANTPPDATIAGASTYAPLVALLANRRIAANEVDTNSKVFLTGMRDDTDFWRRTCADNLQVVISPLKGYFGRRRFFAKAPVASEFEVGETFVDPIIARHAPQPIHALVLREGVTRCHVSP